MSVPYKRLNKDDAVVLLVDHQTGLISLVQDFSQRIQEQRAGTGRHRQVLQAADHPHHQFRRGPNGPIVPELREQFPDAPFIPVLARSTPGTTKISSRRSRPPAASN
jgi:hypothetical protein